MQIRGSIVATAIAVLLTGAAFGEVRYEAIILTGDPVPGMAEGVVFTGTDFASTNDVGDIVFPAFFEGPGIDSDNSVGLFLYRAGELTMLLRTGDTAPGLPTDWTFSSFLTWPSVSDGGDITVLASTVSQDRGQLARGIWQVRSSGLALLAHESLQAPDVGEGVKFASIANGGGPMSSDAGHVVFASWLSGGGVERGTDAALWATVDGELKLLAREGDPAPQAGPRTVFFRGSQPRDSPFRFPISINSTGTAVFSASSTPSDPDSPSTTGIWMGRPGTLRLVIQDGDPAPGLSDGVTFDGVSSPTINNAGQVVFWGAISGPGIDATNGEAIWMLEADGTLHTVARTGDAPDADAPADRYVDLNRFTYGIDGLGRLVFTATLAESGRCIFVGSAESLQRVACAGDDVLSVEGGVWFTVFEAGKITVDGQLAIQAHIEGAGVTSANNLGIWMAQSGGELELVFRGEEAIEVRPDDYRILRTHGFEVFFGFGGGENGWPRKFNDLGQHVSWVSFEDRSQGIIIATLSSDSDGDGIDDAEDTCPEEDATGLDADGDGCIDRLADLPTLIENRAGIGASVLRPMLSMATGALRSAQSGRVRAVRNQLSALAALIKAQTGKKISVDDSVLLRSFMANVVQQELL